MSRLPINLSLAARNGFTPGLPQLPTFHLPPPGSQPSNSYQSISPPTAPTSSDRRPSLSHGEEPSNIRTTPQESPAPNQIGPMMTTIGNPAGVAPSFGSWPFGHIADGSCANYQWAMNSSSPSTVPGPVGQDRPFKCDQCPQSFNRNHDLKRHKRIHLAVKPFPCNHCDKSFSRKDALKRHLLVKRCGSPSQDNATAVQGKNDNKGAPSLSKRDKEAVAPAQHIADTARGRPGGDHFSHFSIPNPDLAQLRGTSGPQSLVSGRDVQAPTIPTESPKKDDRDVEMLDRPASASQCLGGSDLDVEMLAAGARPSPPVEAPGATKSRDAARNEGREVDLGIAVSIEDRSKNRHPILPSTDNGNFSISASPTPMDDNPSPRPHVKVEPESPPSHVKDEHSTSEATDEQFRSPNTKLTSGRRQLATKHNDTVEERQVVLESRLAQSPAVGTGVADRFSVPTAEESQPGSPPLGPLLQRRKTLIIEQLLESVICWLDWRAAVTQHPSDSPRGSAPPTAPPASASNPRSQASLCPSQKHKRVRAASGDPDDVASNSDASDSDAESDDDEPPSKAPKLSHNLFACPFFKHNPARYISRRVCCGPGWASVFRVKEHIYRKHAEPQHRCNWCWVAFDNAAALLTHQRLPERCPFQTPTPKEGIDAAQKEALKCRKRQKDQQGPNAFANEIAKWRAMYRIVFPDVLAENIPSPFYDNEKSSNEAGRGDKNRAEYLAEYKQYLIPRLRARLDRQFTDDLRIFEAGMKQRAIEVIMNTQLEILSEFRELEQGHALRMEEAMPQGSARNTQKPKVKGKGRGEHEGNNTPCGIMVPSPTLPNDAGTVLGEPIPDWPAMQDPSFGVPDPTCLGALQHSFPLTTDDFTALIDSLDNDGESLWQTGDMIDFSGKAWRDPLPAPVLPDQQPSDSGYQSSSPILTRRGEERGPERELERQSELQPGWDML